MMLTTPKLTRTALFVPANRPERVDKAIASNADAVIIDLEDSVPPAEKVTSRATIALKARGPAERPIWVRVNPMETEWFADDVRAAVLPGISCVVVPKPSEAADIERVSEAMGAAERERGMAEQSVGLVPFIESAAALENAYEIACAARDRLWTVAFGAADYTLDMGVDLTAGGEELSYARFRIAVACRAAGVSRPLDTPYMIDIHDLDGLRADAVRVKQCGFGGKLCIHPKQVDVCNGIFTPSFTESERARRAVEAFEEAQRQGRGAVQVDGMMVDYPVYYRMKQVLEQAKDLESIAKQTRERTLT